VNCCLLSTALHQGQMESWKQGLSVWVGELREYQGFQVQLESVKKLSDLEGQQMLSPHLGTQSLLPSVCQHPDLPLDLQPICTSKEAASIFRALTGNYQALDDCELCVNVACTGC
uniref:Guanylate cyclase activator 2B n=1 Tax=Loxodonta africana TaxID=9785 RepID=G3T057_LOXAF